MYQDDIGYIYDENDNYNELEFGNNSDDFINANNNGKRGKSYTWIIIIIFIVFIIILIFLFISCEKKEVMTSINILQDKVYLKLNNTSNLPIELINAENININWQSDNEKIVTVDQNGNIYGVKIGSTNVFANYVDANYKKYSDQCEIIVHQGDVGVSLEDIVELNDIKIEKENVYNFLLKFSPANAYIYSIKYEIVDTKIATIDEVGRINGLSVGITKLNITINDTLTKSINIEVYDDINNSSDNNEDNNENIEPTSVKFDREQINLMVNTDTTLSYSVLPSSSKKYKVSFENSDNTILRLEQDGSIKGLSVGTARITIKINDKLTDTIVVNVEPFVVNVNQIILQSSNEVSMQIGNTSQIKYDIMPSNASNKIISFTTSNKDVATVDENGTIKAVGSGTCVIVAETADGSKSVKISVTVK